MSFINDDISDEVRNEWLDVFSLYDSMGDGTIRNADLGTIMMALGCLFTNSELEKIIEDVDTDGNGTVDFDEFINIMRKYPPTDETEDDLTNALITFSENKQTVSASKFRTFLTNYGESLTDEEIDVIFKRFPLNEEYSIENLVMILKK